MLGNCILRSVVQRSLNRSYVSNLTRVQKEVIEKKMGMKSALVLFAPQAEEVEMVTTIDVLRRAGVSVTVAGLLNKEPTDCSQKTKIMPDEILHIAAKNEFDAVIIPGGPGAKHLAESSTVGDILRKQESKGKIIAAICGGPTVLAAHRVGLKRKITAHPSAIKKLNDFEIIENEPVVQDGNFITSKGPGTAFTFALKIAENLVGIDKVKEIAKGVCYSCA